ncbi:MAG: diguanylate cyclase [Clostridia bacterium]
MSPMIPIIVIFIIVILLIMFMILKRQVDYYKNMSQKIAYMGVMEGMFEIMGSSINAKDKIVALNNAIKEAYNLKYSSIATYDGYSYSVKATNVETEYIDCIKKFSTEKEFKARKKVSKYITIAKNKTLLYRSAVERKICSAMFSPIYYKDMYLGFWIIEDTETDAFEHITKGELTKLKDNIGVFLENVQFQDTLEIAENTDKQTGYYNNMYLYSNARSVLTAFDTSALTLICLKNIPDINEKYGRNIGNALLIKVANSIKDLAPKSSIFIRYSGLRLLIVTPNTNAQLMQPFNEQLINRLKTESEYVGDRKVSLELQVLLHTFKKQNNIEKEIQKMVSYIDLMKDVNSIKII